MASLFPREYGAYAELGFPLLTVSIAGGMTVASACLAATAVAGFLLHEPLAIVRGVRGPRLHDALGAAARARIGVLLVVGIATGLVGLILAPPPARVAALLPAGVGVALVPALLRGNAKSLTGELLVAAALAGMALPVGLAGGLSWRFAGTAAAVWFAGFVLATLVVHAVKARYDRDASRWSIGATGMLAVLILGAGTAALVHDAIPRTVGLALLPTPALVLVVIALAVHPRRLRRVGWALVIANLATLVFLLIAAG